jgi:hypothetical protein
MAKCAHCGKFILGGKKEGPLRYCNDRCYEQGFLVVVAEQVAPELVAARIAEVHGQACPVCGGEAPVDICTSYTALSIFVLTTWKAKPRLSCARCGKKSIFRDIAFTSVFGWWGLPFGLILTPVQLINGFRSLGKLPKAARPSAELQEIVKLQIAREIESGQLDPKSGAAA